MDEATRFQNIRNRPGVTAEYCESRRSQDVSLKLMSKTLATKTTLYKHGKVSQELYVFYQE